MNVLDVYEKYNITPVKASGATVWDNHNNEYLDLYGGHAVISIGHSHPTFVKAIQEQVAQLAFYSNAIENPLQEKLAQTLGRLANLEDYHLFMCNSGAEANENALKIASVVTGRKKILAFHHAFHGRTAAAMACTHNDKVQSHLSHPIRADFIALNDTEALHTALKTEQYAAVILEPIQGVGGLDMPTPKFIAEVATACQNTNTLFIADEIQSGAGRTGNFFGYQIADVQPDIISMAKGMGNGFPVGGILLHPKHHVAKGMLGTTFGGNHLACAASIAVLEVLEKEQLMQRVHPLEDYFREKAKALPQVQVKGRGLMLGLEFEYPVAAMRKELVMQHHIFTGAAANPNVLRILPPLCIKKADLDRFFEPVSVLHTQAHTHV